MKSKKNTNKIVRLSFGDRMFGLINGALLLLFTALVLFPLWHMLVVSISGGNYVISGEVVLIPKGITLTSYKALLSDNQIPNAYLNTIKYTFFGTLVNLIMTSLCAFPLSRPHFYGKTFFNFFVVFTMLFNVGFLANFMVVFSLGLKNTIWAIILPGAISVYNMVIMRTFFQGIPEEMYEAAKIDGANDMQIFLQMALPLSKPVIATLLLFYAVAHWNSFMPGLLYFDNKKDFPMQMILRNIVIGSDMANSETQDVTLIGLSLKYAAIFITIAPILCVYPFVQKFFTKGIMLGSLKG